MGNEPHYHILIIEDNLGDYVLIEEYLAENMPLAHLERAETFAEAKSLLQNVDGRLEVIFLDLSLPDLSGEQLIVEILDLAAGTPVVALTGFSDLDFTIKSMSLGVADYLLKDELTPTILYKTIVYSIERRKFIDQIQRSEKRYSDLFQISPLPMWVVELETLAFLSVNRAAIQHYGYSKEEFLSMNLFDIRLPEEIKEFKKTMELARSSEFPRTRIIRHLKKSGETIIVEKTFSRLVFNDKEAVLILANDITDRTRYIETIEKQNQAFSEIAWIQSHVVRAPLARLLGLVNLLEIDAAGNDKEIKSLLGFIRDSANELDQIIRDINDKSETIERLDRKD